jgi:hypothetical protein
MNMLKMGMKLFLKDGNEDRNTTIIYLTLKDCCGKIFPVNLGKEPFNDIERTAYIMPLHHSLKKS